MAVVDKDFYKMERELLDKYGSWSKVPEDDTTLMKIRVLYGWKKRTWQNHKRKPKNKEE